MIKISKRQQKKNSKVLEYLFDYSINSFSRMENLREVVIGKNNKWRTFRLYNRSDRLMVSYHALWGIETCYEKRTRLLHPKPKKVNYLVWLKYLNKNQILLKIVQECAKETIREDISFSTLMLLKILSNNKVNYMKVEYYL